MTEVFRQSTVGEQGRVYTRRGGLSEQTAKQPAAALVDTGVSQPSAFRDLKVGELLLKQFGPVYVADANFNLIYATDGFIELSRDAWGFEVDLSSNAIAPTPLRNVLEGLAETGRFEPNHTEVRRSGMTRLYLGRHFINEGDNGRLFYGYFEDVTRNTTLEKKAGGDGRKTQRHDPRVIRLGVGDRCRSADDRSVAAHRRDYRRAAAYAFGQTRAVPR